jgi:hypothetical protein
MCGACAGKRRKFDGPLIREVAGLAPLDLLMALDLAHKRGRVCVRGQETAMTKFHFAQAVPGMGEH